MPMRKLTLTASREVISPAEEQATREKTSISAMFSNFIPSKSRLNNNKAFATEHWSSDKIPCGNRKAA